MSALGQKRTCAVQNVMSALAPKADIPVFHLAALHLVKMKAFVSLSVVCHRPVGCARVR